jgi:hypothetical protein
MTAAAAPEAERMGWSFTKRRKSIEVVLIRDNRRLGKNGKGKILLPIYPGRENPTFRVDDGHDIQFFFFFFQNLCGESINALW